MRLDPEIETQVERLTSLDLEGPRTRSQDLLRRMLAWKLQEEAYGGLDAETRRLLTKKAVVARGPQLGAGARLVREWKAGRHEVEVAEDGSVAYGGERYASLSEVARAITGTRWNGPRFFGLRGLA